MSWNTDFHAACMSNANFSNDITTLFLEANRNAVAPYARYQMIAAVGTNDLQGIGEEGERNIQLSVWSSSPITSEQLARFAKSGVKDQLELMSVYERSLGHDEDEDLYGYAIDFVVWFQNP